jgi:hypothetical protein
MLSEEPPKSNPLPIINEDGSIGIQQRLELDFGSTDLDKNT